MTLHAYRIVKAKHAGTAFTGEGARRFGGRWNSPGTGVVYAAGSAALAMLELLVHLAAQELLGRYVLFPLAFDDRLVAAIDVDALPRNWRTPIPGPATQRLGDQWVAARRSAVLRAPSAVVPGEWLYLLNPAHAEFGQVRIGRRRRVTFDTRLIRRR